MAICGGGSQHRSEEIEKEYSYGEINKDGGGDGIEDCTATSIKSDGVKINFPWEKIPHV